MKLDTARAPVCYLFAWLAIHSAFVCPNEVPCLFVEFTMLNWRSDICTDFKTSTVYEAIWTTREGIDINLWLLVVEGKVIRSRVPRIYRTKHRLRIGISRKVEFFQLKVELTSTSNGVFTDGLINQRFDYTIDVISNCSTLAAPQQIRSEAFIPTSCFKP